MNVSDLTRGAWYRITYQIPGVQRKPRVCVMQYLGADATLDELQFSLRPISGTSSLRRHWIISVEPSAEAKPMQPKAVA